MSIQTPQRRAPLATPRNLQAARHAAQTGEQLVISFAGDTPWLNPTIYCDQGKAYDWSCLDGQPKPVTVAVRGRASIGRALAATLKRANPMAGYPALVDLERQDVSYLVDGAGGKLELWPVKHGSGIWREYFQ